MSFLSTYLKSHPSSSHYHFCFYPVWLIDNSSFVHPDKYEPARIPMSIQQLFCLVLTVVVLLCWRSDSGVEIVLWHSVTVFRELRHWCSAAQSFLSDGHVWRECTTWTPEGVLQRQALRCPLADWPLVTGQYSTSFEYQTLCQTTIRSI